MSVPRLWNEVNTNSGDYIIHFKDNQIVSIFCLFVVQSFCPNDDFLEGGISSPYPSLLHLLPDGGGSDRLEAGVC